MDEGRFDSTQLREAFQNADVVGFLSKRKNTTKEDVIVSNFYVFKQK